MSNNCKYYREDESYNIGNVKVNIYYSEYYCEYLFANDKDSYILNSYKVRMFLKDAIINKLKEKDIIILWLDNFLNYDYFEMLDMLIGFGLDIYIMVNF